MNVFIVYAHSEPMSFNGAMKDLAVSILNQQGHTVQVSDLYSMKFKAVADKDDFLELSDPNFFKYQIEQINAYQQHKFTPDIVAEQEKLLWADFVIFQFALWWFSFPGIMKGWVDRILSTGFAYGPPNKPGGLPIRYDNGGLKGRKAMLALTTGAPYSAYTPTGMNGDIHQILYPINHGILRFVGFDLLPPYIAYSPARVGQEKRKEYLEEYQVRLLNWETTDIISYHPLADYDDNLQLKQEALSL